MSDLISRKAVIEALNKQDLEFMQQSDLQAIIRETVNNVPTAYDMNTVLEEFGDLRDTTINTEYAPCETYGTECVDKAIVIVKGGGQGE